MDSDQLGILFCTTIAQVNRLHETFTHCSSHSKRPSSHSLDDEHRWKGGEKRWMAATTGLIHGVDIPNVGATVFLGLPYGLLNLYQGSGRAGRDGRRSFSVVLTPKNHTQVRSRNHPMDEDLGCQAEGVDWIEWNGCRRVRLSMTLDGTDTACEDLPNCHLCDWCQPESPLLDALRSVILDPPPPTLRQSIDQVMATQEEDLDDDFPDLSGINWGLDDDFGAALDGTQTPPTPTVPRNDANSLANPPAHLAPPTTTAPSMPVLMAVSHYHQQIRSKKDKAALLSRYARLLLGKCFICWASRQGFRPTHRDLFVACHSGGARVFNDHMVGWMDFKKLIKFPKYKYCFRCGLPQEREFCPTAHPDLGSGDKGKKHCPLEDFAVLLIWFIRHDQEWWPRAVTVFPGLEFQMGVDTFGRWAAAGESLSSFYNGLELVLWFFSEMDLKA
jgi:Helicase conserved C-terminal domain